MTWIKTKIIMLPSDTGVILQDKLDSNIQLSIYKDGDLNEDKSGNVIGRMSYILSRQHLYFISDEEIKEDDWCLFGHNLDTLLYVDCVANKKLANKDSDLYKKIIASSDPKLINQSGNMMYKSDECDLPQPSQEFIKQYCETGGIDEVEIEYEVTNYQSSFGGDIDIYGAKVNPDNTINIRMIKDSYSREEVESLIQKYRMYVGITDRFDLASCNNWIKENLN